jgi:hypothetical protein
MVAMHSANVKGSRKCLAPTNIIESSRAESSAARTTWLSGAMSIGRRVRLVAYRNALSPDLLHTQRLLWTSEKLRTFVLIISPAQTTFAQPGFTPTNAKAQTHFEEAGCSFVRGYDSALKAENGES